ncbi:MAG: hypothetical protein IJ881_02545 [Neisseriaceae bacterium]|nr:hypothetical protein [Neisseriaceae bacterium]MBR3426074.1 hypothetical protein [Neisseriaceae bacterium]
MKFYSVLLCGALCLTACGGKTQTESDSAIDDHQPMTALEKAIDEQDKCLEKSEEAAKKDYEQRYGKMPTVMSEKEVEQWGNILNNQRENDCRAEMDKVDELSGKE